MTIKQLFYTSCKKGLSSGMGFQTYSMSEGISNEDRKEIEGYCVYIPPDNLPTQPSDKEIDEMFPIAFSYFRLKSGKYCICSAKYTGKDYSGRYGNYFCHVLISDKEWSFYPIELYGSTIFKTNLTYEEENADKIECLPELKEVPLGTLINFDSVANFLKASNSGKRRKGFTELIKCCIGFSSNGKRIIFCDHEDNVPYWIGAVQISLPKKLSQDFSFTTYCYNLEDAPYTLCAADNKGSRFNFKDKQKLYKYNIFDFDNMEFLETDYNSSFAKRAEVGYTVSKEAFLPFLSFVQQFEYKTLNEDIDKCICLYNMVNRGIDKANIEDVKNAVSFAMNYKSIEAYEELFKLLQPNLEKISTQVDIELTDIITKFLFMVGRETNNNEYTMKAYEFFFNSIHYLVMDAEEIAIEDILDLYKSIRAIEEVAISQFVKLSIHKDRIKELKTYLEGGRVRHAKFYFKSVLDDIMIFNNRYAVDNGIGFSNIASEEVRSITIFLNKCLSIIIQFPKDILDILNDLKYEPVYFSDIIVRSYCINNYLYKNKKIQDNLAEFIIEEGNVNKDWKMKIYLSISKLSGGSNLLFDVFNLELKSERNKKGFFIDYCHNTFSYLKDYRKRKFSDGLKSYMDLCENTASLEDYKEVINYVDMNFLDKNIHREVLERLFTAFENKIDIENIEEEIYTIEKVIKIKKKNNVNTPCSISELTYIGLKIEKSTLPDKMTYLEEIKVDFSNMDGDKYKSYLKWFLFNLCPYIKSPIEHDKVTEVLFCKEYRKLYYDEYLNVFEEIIFNKKHMEGSKLRSKEEYEIFADFLIFLFKSDLDLSKNLQDYLNDKIADMLKELSEKKLEIYSNYIEREVSSYNNKTEIVYKWIIVREKVKEKRHKKTHFNIFKK